MKLSNYLQDQLNQYSWAKQSNMAESNILCNENTPVVITSDTHFGQKRTFELSKRDRAFSSVENMDTVMIKYFKDELIMNPNAIFIHLGDRGGDPLNPNHIHETMRSFNILADKSYLILGNYEVCEMKNLNMSFDEYREYLIIKEGWTNVFKHIAFITSPYKIENGLNPRYCLIHDPLDFCCMKKYFQNNNERSDINDLYCLFGHIHGRQMVKRFGIDVGVDCHNYKPIKIQDCDFFINAIERKYYDDSVFC